MNTNYFSEKKPVRLQLARDLSKHLKQGNPWVFSDVIVAKPKADSGSPALLYSPKNELLGFGFFCPHINLCFRMVKLADKKISPHEIETRLERALSLRAGLLSKTHQALRLINGEGDELPGLVLDLYADVAVMKLDGEASEQFWNAKAIAQYLIQQTIVPLKTVYLKRRNNEENKGEILAGEKVDLLSVKFYEHDVLFETNLIDAAKTGFFLDQRENRYLIGQLAKNKTLLNLFSYTGGFSLYAGKNGALSVTSVDISHQATAASVLNWKLNGLEENKHLALAQDVFEFVKEKKALKEKWDIVIVDPPSFAPNQKSVETAKTSYENLFVDCLSLVKPHGLIAFSSCSAHISFEEFGEICAKAISKARKRGRILTITGQPIDHPYPMALPQMRYLKFFLVQID